MKTTTSIRKRHRALLPFALACTLLLGGAAHAGPWLTGQSKTVTARCDKGQSLAKAVAKASPGDRVVVTGQCNELVVVTTSHLTIEGQNAVIDGAGVPRGELEALLTIDGARSVSLKGLTVRNSGGSGIAILAGGSARLENVSAQSNTLVGLFVQQSSATISDSSFTGNFNGINANTGSSLIFSGSVAVSQNQFDGVSIAGASVLELRNAQVELDSNFGGLVVLGGSRVVTWAYASSANNNVNITNNFAGMVLLSADLSTYAPATTFNATGNTIGFFVPAGTMVCAFQSGSFNVEGNQVGIQLTENGNAAIDCDMLVTNNGVGILGDGAGTLGLGPDIGTPPAVTQTIQGNGTDLLLSFGTRATLVGTAVGSIVCDPTVLSRGTTVCPP